MPDGTTQITLKPVETANGWQFPASSQWPMDQASQKRAGLVASTSRSITGRAVRLANDAPKGKGA